MLGRHIRTLGRANELTGIPQAALPCLGLHQIFGCGPYPSNIESWRILEISVFPPESSSKKNRRWTNTVKVNAIEWPYESVWCSGRKPLLENDVAAPGKYEVNYSSLARGCNVTTIGINGIGWYRILSPMGWWSQISGLGISWDAQICVKTFTSDRGPPTLAMSFASIK